MAACNFGNLTVPPGELERSTNWRLKGSVLWASPTRGKKEQRLNGLLTKQILKLNAVSRSTSKIRVKPTWYQAGYARLIVDKTEVLSESLPLGGSYLVFPVANQSYRLEVWPRQWLPNLKVEVREYIGPLLQPEVLTRPDPAYEFEDFEEFVEGSQDYGADTDSGYQ